MTKVKELVLSVTSQEILGMFNEWVKLKPDYYSVTPIQQQAFEAICEKIYDKFDFLARLNVGEFRALLACEDLVSSNSDGRGVYSVAFNTQKFFVEYLGNNQDRHNNFLQNCSAEQLAVFVKSSLGYWSSDYNHSHNINGYNIYLANIKVALEESLSQIKSRNDFDSEQLDSLLVIIVESLVEAYHYLNPNNGVPIDKKIKLQNREYYAPLISSTIKSISDINITGSYGSTLLDMVFKLDDNANQHPKMVIDLVYYLVNKGIKISRINGFSKETLKIPLDKVLCNQDEEMHKFLIYALNQNPNISKSAITEAMVNAISAYNIGAISALFNFILQDEAWVNDRLKLVNFLRQDSQRPGDEAVNGALFYLRLTNISICELLEDVDTRYGEDSQVEVVKNLVGNWGRYVAIKPAYLRHEESEAKNFFYYLALNPQKCTPQNSTVFKSYATSSMFIKSNPELCPLTLAINTHNIVFIILVLDLMGSRANEKLSKALTAGILNLIDQGADPKNIVSHLEGAVGKYSRPFRWSTFEYTLLKTINDKLYSLHKETAQKENSRHTLRT